MAKVNQILRRVLWLLFGTAFIYHSLHTSQDHFQLAVIAGFVLLWLELGEKKQ